MRTKEIDKKQQIIPSELADEMSVNTSEGNPSSVTIEKVSMASVKINTLQNNDFELVINKKRRNSDPKIAETRRYNKLAKTGKKQEAEEDLLMGNRYEPLSDLEDGNDMEVDNRPQRENKQQTGRKCRPPSIVIQGQPASGKHIKLIQLLNEGVADRKYKIKYINIYVETNEAHERLIKMMTERGA